MKSVFDNRLKHSVSEGLLSPLPTSPECWQGAEIRPARDVGKSSSVKPLNDSPAGYIFGF